jgi:pimeloyl-ACP methyl ester carboxylesterase/DNA-binding CsgD family transcriptional regulator
LDAPPVQYVRTSDGYDIAYAVSGSGLPLVFTPPLLVDIQGAWQLYPAWLEGLAARFRLIQYDPRGQGFSTRSLAENTTVLDFGRDLEAVVDRLNLDRFLIWGWGSRSHHAIRYARARPGRVAGLILVLSSVVNMVFHRILFTTLAKEDWDTLLFTVAGRGFSPEEHDRRVDILRRGMTQAEWDATMRCERDSNVEAELKELPMPALLLHPRDYPRLPATEAMKVAALIPNAQFQLIDGADILGDAPQGLNAIDSFVTSLAPVGHPVGSTLPAGTFGNLSSRELDVLRLLAAGRTNPQIAEALVISPSTVAKHVSSILDKTGAANRTEAAAYAHTHRLV